MTIKDIVNSDLEVYPTNYSPNSIVSSFDSEQMLDSSPHLTTNMGTQLSKRILLNLINAF